MPDTSKIVINTGPILALTAALGSLHILDKLYSTVYVPAEVCSEVLIGGASSFGVQQFMNATWLTKLDTDQVLPSFLNNTLDTGEAAVIQLALSEQISTVCIDEAVGRRIARLNGLALTGSIGILLRAKRESLISNITEPLGKMRASGIWLSDKVMDFAIQQSGEM